MMSRIVRVWHGLSTVFGVIAAILVMGIMTMMLLDVVARTSVGRSLPGLYELVELSMAAAVFLGLPAAQRDGGMVRVELLLQRLKPFALKGVLACVWALSLAICATLTYAALQIAVNAFTHNEIRTGIVSIPVWPSRLAIAIGLIVLCGEILITLVGAARQKSNRIDITQSEAEL